MSRCKVIVAAGFLCLVHGPASAADRAPAADLAGAGGTVAAASEANAAIVESPGVLGLHERYDLHGHFQYGPDGALRWAASAVDSRTSKWLTAGLYYWGDRANPPFTKDDLPGWKLVGDDPSNLRKHHEFVVGLGFRGFDRRFGFGINGAFSIYDHEHQGAGSTGNVGAGLGARPTDWLDLAAAGRNLVPVDDIGVLPLSVIGGVRVHGRQGAVLADLEWQEDTRRPWTAAGGGELALEETAVLRAGYRYEGPSDRHALTVGASAVGEGGAVDLAAQVPVGPGEPSLTGFSLIIGFRFAAPDMDAPPPW